MDKAEMIYLASIFIGKDMDYEEAKYSDYLYNVHDNNETLDEIWEYVEECYENGAKAFREKYQDYKLYPGV